MMEILRCGLQREHNLFLNVILALFLILRNGVEHHFFNVLLRYEIVVIKIVYIEYQSDFDVLVIRVELHDGRDEFAEAEVAISVFISDVEDSLADDPREVGILEEGRLADSFGGVRLIAECLIRRLLCVGFPDMVCMRCFVLYCRFDIR
jgi:hypothetical protein